MKPIMDAMESIYTNASAVGNEWTFPFRSPAYMVELSNGVDYEEDLKRVCLHLQEYIIIRPERHFKKF